MTDPQKPNSPQNPNIPHNPNNSVPGGNIPQGGPTGPTSGYPGSSQSAGTQQAGTQPAGTPPTSAAPTGASPTGHLPPGPPAPGYPQPGPVSPGAQSPSAQPPGPGVPPGPGWAPAPQQPKSKLPWLVGSALIALIAVVLIVVLGSDDDDSASEGGFPGPGASTEQGGIPGQNQQPGGSGSASAPTCEPGEYGVKVDPATGDSIVCDGGQQAGDSSIEAMNGSWSVTATITAIEGELKNDGVPLQVGDSTWAGPHDWSMQSVFCPTGTGCTMTVGDLQVGAIYSFSMQGSSWIGETTYPVYCDDGAEDALEVTFEIPVEPTGGTTSQGTMTTVSNGACGGEVLSIVETLSFSR